MCMRGKGRLGSELVIQAPLVWPSVYKVWGLTMPWEGARDGPRLKKPVRDPGPENEEQVRPWARPQLNHVACLSLFTDPSEPFPEEPKPVEMPSHHCHRDPLPQPGLTPERLQAQRQLCAACAVCCVFMAGEVVGKFESSSSNRICCELPLPLSTQSPRDVPGWRYREDGEGWHGEVGC